MKKCFCKLLALSLSTLLLMVAAGCSAGDNPLVDMLDDSSSQNSALNRLPGNDESSSAFNPFAVEFDASRYIKGMLDVQYLNEYDDFKATTTATDAECEEIYRSGLEVEAETFANYFDIRVLTDETKARIVDFYDEVYSHSKYEVKDAYKTDEGYTVEVVISPIDIFMNIEEEVNSYIDGFNTRIEAGEFDALDEDAFEDIYAAGILDIVEAKVDTIGYEEDKSVTVSVKEGEDGLYDITPEEFATLDQWIIAY